MYLYPVLIEDKFDYRNIKDLEILTIIAEHMNQAAINSVKYLLKTYLDIKNEEKSEKKANKYLNVFFPQELKGKKKILVLEEILEALKSPVLRDIRKEYVSIIYKALMNFYAGIDKYTLNEVKDEGNKEETNIFRIKDKNKRDIVINYFKENIDNFKDIYDENDEELILLSLMKNIEDINSYKSIILELEENDDFLHLLPISFYPK